MDYLKLIFGALLMVGAIVDSLILMEKDLLSEKKFSLVNMKYKMYYILMLIFSFIIGLGLFYKELA